MIGQREGKKPRHSNSRPIRSTPLNTPKECYALKQQIEILVGQRKLQRTRTTQQDRRPILLKKAPFGRQPPYKRDLMGRSYLTLRISNAWRIFTCDLKKKRWTTNTAYPSTISSRYYRSSKSPRWRTIWEMINSSSEGKHGRRAIDEEYFYNISSGRSL